MKLTVRDYDLNEAAGSSLSDLSDEAMRVYWDACKHGEVQTWPLSDFDNYIKDCLSRADYDGRVVAPESLDNPVIVALFHDGEYYLLDGHHRTMLKRMSGAESINVFVIELLDDRFEVNPYWVPIRRLE